MNIPTWLQKILKLITSSVRHPNTTHTVTVSDGKVEVTPQDKLDDRAYQALAQDPEFTARQRKYAASQLPPVRDEHDPEIDLG